MNFSSDNENVTALDDNRVGRQKHGRERHAFKLCVLFVFLDIFEFAFEMREKFRLFENFEKCRNSFGNLFFPVIIFREKLFADFRRVDAVKVFCPSSKIPRNSTAGKDSDNTNCGL